MSTIINPFRFPTEGGGELPVSGAVADWNPATLALSDGASVASWVSAVGSEYAAQADGAKQPIYRASVTVMNNQPAVEFDILDDGLLTDLNIANPFTIYLVESGESELNVSRTLTSRDNNALISVARGDGNNAFNSGNVSAFRLTAPAVAVLVVGAESRYYVNGVDRTGDASKVGDWGRLAFGTGGAVGAGEPAATKVGRCIVFPSDHGTSDRQAMQALLGTLFGLTIY